MRVANKIIISADDFGYSDAINGAVLKCFQRWLVTSSSLLVNMPGFQSAVEIVHANSILSGKIGVRLNLSEGFSLTSAIRECARFCHASGSFLIKEDRTLLLLTARERFALYEEMRVQLETALMAGIRPSHLDVHHSLHKQLPVAALLAKLGREYGIPRIRFIRNMGLSMRGMSGHYRELINRLAWKYMGIGGPDISGDVCDLLGMPEKRRPSGKFVEIAVHPALDEFGDIIDRDGKGLQQKLRTITDHRHTITYRDLPVGPERRSLAGLMNKLVFQPLREQGKSFSGEERTLREG